MLVTRTPLECLPAADLARLITLVIENMGARVLLGRDRENLCRRALPREMAGLGGFEWVIESEGLPNLVHEIVHALFLGRLADDHGFDYGQIPLDLALPEHRRHLWEELTCCVLSTVICAPLEDDPESFACDWFAEQFEIQGVFHGLERDLVAFRAHIQAQLEIAEHRAELLETVARGRALLIQALATVGFMAELPQCDVLAIWDRYRASWSGDVPGVARL
ncbi:MAG: hypothetical protein R6X02_17580 [Enhygromyxa sp.]